MITGTQTGHIKSLAPDHYSLVTACYPLENRLIAEGPSRPSAESLTHGMLYALDSAIRFVFHVHCPALWHSAAALQIPISDQSVPYGSPELASEIERLFLDGSLRNRCIFSMGGHEDGLVSFGASAEEAGSIIFNLLNSIVA